MKFFTTSRCCCRRILMALYMLGFWFLGTKVFAQQYITQVAKDGTIEVTPASNHHGFQFVTLSPNPHNERDLGFVLVDGTYSGVAGSRIALAAGKHEVAFHYSNDDYVSMVMALRIDVAPEGMRVNDAEFQSSNPSCFPLRDADKAHLAAADWRKSVDKVFAPGPLVVLKLPPAPQYLQGCFGSARVISNYGTLRVTSVPTSADIYIDGSQTGTTDTTLRVAATHSTVRVLIRKAGYFDVAKEIEVREQGALDVKLAPEIQSGNSVAGPTPH